MTFRKHSYRLHRTSLLMAAIALFGSGRLPGPSGERSPERRLPTLLVTASLPGASPETMASSVATPLENQFSHHCRPVLDDFGEFARLDSGHSGIRFEPQSGWRPPRWMSRRPSHRQSFAAARYAHAAYVHKVNPPDQPILYLAMTSKTVPL